MLKSEELVQEIKKFQSKIDYPKEWYKDKDLNFMRGYIEGLKFSLKIILENNSVKNGQD